MSEITPVTHTEKVVAGQVDAVTHFEKVIAKYGGGGGGGGFTPTDEQLAAMNSGITAEDVEQIDTNKNNIALIKHADNTSIYIQETKPTGAIGDYWISSTNGVKVYGRTANISTQSYVNKGLNWSDGSISDTVLANRMTTADYTDIVASGQVTCAVYDTGSNRYSGVLLEYSADGTYTGNYQEWHDLPYTWDVGSNVKFRLGIRKADNSDIDIADTKIMINTGSTAAAYVPYYDWG